jgi:hypothetical protein
MPYSFTPEEENMPKKKPYTSGPTLRQKVEKLRDRPNWVVRVRRGHLLRKIGTVTYLRNPHTKTWDSYQGAWGFAGPYVNRRVGLPIDQAQKVVEQKINGRVKFLYGREQIWLERRGYTTTLYSPKVGFKLIWENRRSMNIVLAIRAVICRLEWLLSANGTFMKLKAESIEEAMKEDGDESGS